MGLDPETTFSPDLSFADEPLGKEVAALHGTGRRSVYTQAVRTVFTIFGMAISFELTLPHF